MTGGRMAARGGIIGLLGAALVLAPLLCPGATALAPPALPPEQYTSFLANLSVPVTAPGSSVTFAATLHDPLAMPITSTNLTFEFYAFDAFPGNASGPIPAGQSPEFSGVGGSGSGVSFLLGTVASSSTVPVGSTVVVPTGASGGDYAIRSQLTFVANGTYYVLESRGYFTADQWSNATRLLGNASTLNLTRLGVSGLLPETAVPVRVTAFPTVLVVLGIAGAILAAAGGYYAFRGGPVSSSGASSARPPTSAPRAFGNRRRRDGD